MPDAGRSRGLLLFFLRFYDRERTFGVFVRLAEQHCALAVGVAVLYLPCVLCTVDFDGAVKVGDCVRL